MDANIRKEIKEALREVLIEEGMKKGWVSRIGAQKDFGFSKRQIDNGIRDGWLNPVRGKGKNSKINIPITELKKYRDHLSNKLKTK